jgi:hypothetical protein
MFAYSRAASLWSCEVSDGCRPLIVARLVFGRMAAKVGSRADVALLSNGFSSQYDQNAVINKRTSQEERPKIRANAMRRSDGRPSINE